MNDLWKGERPAAALEWRPFPSGYMECGGVFWNKQPQNLTWIANQPWQIDAGRLCISATATKRQTVHRLMLLQLNVQIYRAASWPRREEDTSDTPHWNACYLLLVFIGCRSGDKVALVVWRETERNEDWPSQTESVSSATVLHMTASRRLRDAVCFCLRVIVCVRWECWEDTWRCWWGFKVQL